MMNNELEFADIIATFDNANKTTSVFKILSLRRVSCPKWALTTIMEHDAANLINKANLYSMYIDKALANISEPLTTYTEPCCITAAISAVRGEVFKNVDCNIMSLSYTLNSSDGETFNPVMFLLKETTLFVVYENGMLSCINLHSNHQSTIKLTV